MFGFLCKKSVTLFEGHCLPAALYETDLFHFVFPDQPKMVDSILNKYLTRFHVPPGLRIGIKTFLKKITMK